MKQINSSSDLEAMLRAEHAVVLIFFPWSEHAENSLRVVAGWQQQTRAANGQVFQLTPDSRPFSWLWLGAIFGQTSDEQRTRGTVIWLRNGSVAAIVRDAGAAGIKTLDRVTHDCFVLGKSYADSPVQIEPAPFDVELLKILCCPETHQTLALAEASALDKVNERLASGCLRNRAGQPVREKIEDGLVRADGRYLYPMRRNIPVLLVDEAIPL